MRRAWLLIALAACSFKAGAAATDSGGADSPRDARRSDATADGSGSGSGSGSGMQLARSGIDIVSGGGRLHAGAIQIDVEIGTAVPSSRVSAGSIAIEGAQAVVP